MPPTTALSARMDSCRSARGSTPRPRRAAQLRVLVAGVAGNVELDVATPIDDQAGDQCPLVANDLGHELAEPVAGLCLVDHRGQALRRPLRAEQADLDGRRV